MRILLVIGEQPIERELVHVLAQGGHQLTLLTAGGESLMCAVEESPRFHAAVLNQAVLGKKWPRQIRQLRRLAPYLPALVLLARGAEHAWRPAIVAGAFEAVPLRSALEVILEALSRALEYSAGRPLQEVSESKGGHGTFALPSVRPSRIRP